MQSLAAVYRAGHCLASMKEPEAHIVGTDSITEHGPHQLLPFPASGPECAVLQLSAGPCLEPMPHPFFL